MVELRRGLRAIEFWIILATSVLGALGVSPWIAIPLGAGGLMLCAWPKYEALLSQVWRAGAEGEFVKTLALSTLNSLAVAGTAFTLGVVIRWLWP